MGLAIAKQLVELMGGEMGVVSEPNRGSTFWFELPVELAGPMHLSQACCEASEPLANYRQRVLVVEDNGVNQIVAKGLLEKFGCCVDLAADGLEAIEAVEKTNYALIFMDCNMPRMDGYECTQYIRQHQLDGPRIPIVAMTANVMAECTERCRNSGMDDFVAKPIKKQELLRVLDRWLGDSELST